MSDSIIRTLASLFLALTMSSTLAFAHAQEDGEDEEVILDTVEVTAIQTDKAMAAFQAGDYATAEVEFLDNAMCALRRERNLTASIDNARLSSQRADTVADSAASNSGANSQGAGAGAPQGAQVGLGDVGSIAARNVETEVDRTCEKRARQLYFAALSQVQLGKTDDALRNFERATSVSKVMYDAHYRIALINLLQGNEKQAASELKKIEGILKRCRKCEARQEIVDRRDHLAKALQGDVQLQ